MGLILSYIIIFLLAIYAGDRLRRILNQDKNALASFLVLIPQKKSKSGSLYHSQADINLSNELYRRLIEFKIPFSLEAVVESVGEEIKFYIFVSRQHEKKVGRIISSLWPEAEMPEVDYELWSTAASNKEFKAGEHTIINYLHLKEPYSLPIQATSDIFSPILQSLSSLKIIGEAVSIQWVVRPAHPQIKRDIGANIENIYAGEHEKISKHSPEDFLLTPETVKTLEWKVSQPLIATNCRIISHSVSPRRTTQISENLKNLFENSIKDPKSNRLEVSFPKNQDEHLAAFLNHELKQAQEMILNTHELANFFHFPGAKAIPKAKRAL